jgi:hypothetical protein
MTTTAQPAAGAEVGDEPLPCPLCNYDLRGLTEPRCPECGYRFAWEDLTDPAKRRHPYLFEHHPRRNLWSFARTMIGGLRPHRFWSSLKPSQPSRPGRLLLYWFLATLLLPLAYGAMIARTGLAGASEQLGLRNSEIARVSRALEQAGRDPSPAVSVVDQFLPHPASPAYWHHVFGSDYAYWFPTHVRIALLYAAWPWLTLLATLVFRASMRLANVRTTQMLRCSLYCCDAAVWLVFVTLPLPRLMFRLDFGRYIAYQYLAPAALVYASVTTWRLSSAFRHYLQFDDHPLGAAIAVQTIALLAFWVMLFLVNPMFDF